MLYPVAALYPKYILTPLSVISPELCYETPASRILIAGLSQSTSVLAPTGSTVMGRIKSECITTAYFIPPVNPATKKTQEILTVNGVMTVCTGER